MAQIHLYQRQQSVPRTAGSEIQVAGIQDETGKALMGLGDQFGKIGGKLQLAQDNRDVSTAVLNGTLKMQNLTTEMSKLDGQTAITTYQARANALHTEITTGMNTRTLDAFNRQWNTLYAGAEAKIKSAGITRWRLQLEGGMEGDLDARVKMARVGTALEQLKNMQDGVKSIDYLVSQRVIDPKEGEKRKIKFRLRLAKAGLDMEITNASVEKLEELAAQMQTGIFKDVSLQGYWFRLNGTEKASFKKKVLSVHKNILDIADNDEKRDIVKDKRKHARNFSKRMKAIILGQQSIDDYDTLSNLPTQASLLDDLELGLIDGRGYDKLINALKNENPVRDDNEYVKSILGRIRAASNERALEKIISDMELVLGPRGKLTFETFRTLEQRALGAVSGTPEEKRKNVYSRALERFLSDEDMLDQMVPGGKRRAAFARLDFEARLADGQDPMEAFEIVLDHFNTRRTVQLNAIPRPQFGPAKPLDKWTEQDAAMAERETKTRFRGKANTLATQLLILNMLGAYLRKRGPIDTVPPPGGPSDAGKTNLKNLRGGDN